MGRLFVCDLRFDFKNVDIVWSVHTSWRPRDDVASRTQKNLAPTEIGTRFREFDPVIGGIVESAFAVAVC